MGNYRFRLSDMIPNAWFYKLRDMSKSRNHNTTPCLLHPTKKKLPNTTQNPRNSNPQTSAELKLFTSPKNPKTSDTHFPHIDPPRKSSKKIKTKRKTIYSPSPKQVTPSFPVWLKPEPVQFRDSFNGNSTEHEDFLDDRSESEFFDSFHDRVLSHQSWSSRKLGSPTNDIIIDLDKTSYSKNIEKPADFNIELPPILTKPKKTNGVSVQENSFSPTTKKKLPRAMKTNSPSSRKSVSRTGKVKIKGNWQKFSGKKNDNGGRKSVPPTGERKGMFYSQSFAIVKASMDPEQDFRDSMMEMIVENNIRASKDLEELLACYLSLNSNQYHDLIIKAFEQIWFNMPQTRL